ncbi:MAG: MFS transporter [Pseudomonadota bacterium]
MTADDITAKPSTAIWLGFALMSVFFFHVVSTTFTSLGVVLPYMIEAQSWSWAEAGLGFSILALVVGLASMVPVSLIRRSGIKLSMVIGGAAMIAGFVLLATTSSLVQYFFGTGLAGFGYTLCSTVPGVHYINTKFAAANRSRLIGIYLTIGGLGGVFGPLLVTSVVSATGDWRTYWWVSAVITAALIVLAVILLNGDAGASPADRADAEKAQEASASDWTYGEVVRCKQYYIIVAALTLTLLCGLTLNSWAVTHMKTLGVSATIAAGALSGHALINALSRALGTALVTRVAAKWLLVSALAAEAGGMVALAYADRPLTITLFGLGEGYGYGMCLFATTVLLVDYFGTSKNPEVFGLMHLITTVAMIGPVFAGFVAERVGGFGPVFLGYGAVVFCVMLTVATMTAPMRPQNARKQETVERGGALAGEAEGQA